MHFPEHHSEIPGGAEGLSFKQMPNKKLEVSRNGERIGEIPFHRTILHTSDMMKVSADKSGKTRTYRIKTEDLKDLTARHVAQQSGVEHTKATEAANHNTDKPYQFFPVQHKIADQLINAKKDNQLGDNKFIVHYNPTNRLQTPEQVVVVDLYHISQNREQAVPFAVEYRESDHCVRILEKSEVEGMQSPKAKVDYTLKGYNQPEWTLFKRMLKKS